MTQISLASQEVSQDLYIWFYRQSSVTEETGASNHPLWAVGRGKYNSFKIF